MRFRGMGSGLEWAGWSEMAYWFFSASALLTMEIWSLHVRYLCCINAFVFYFKVELDILFQ